MAKNTRESVIPDVYDDYVLTEADKKLLTKGGSVLLPVTERDRLPDGQYVRFELVVLLNPDTDMYEFQLASLYPGTLPGFKAGFEMYT